ncbi:MAG: potassium transporter Kef [Deltaproteobacteria bacterium]|jgi:hypothetical protein|nr:potassium transporter Kef [Deltaproteobacteria bacterium]MDP7463446.1 ion channel [SAR324 cluster bacterium]MDP7629800.1 ion channel [SAR324 cluster bacterium]
MNNSPQAGPDLSRFKPLDHCAFTDSKGHYCQERLGRTGLCFWHDPLVDKTHMEVKSLLEQHCREGKSGEGFKLRGVNLLDVHLERSGTRMGFNLSYADLTHANLHGAHLFRVNFRHASLHKASLNKANLNRANFEHSTLLGTEFGGTHLEHVHWGERVLQEDYARESQRANKLTEALTYFEEAEEVYRNLRRGAEERGYFELAGDFFHHEMVMNRNKKPLLSLVRVFSKFEDFVTGYGEKPSRVLRFAALLIVCYALAYFFVGIHGDGHEVVLDSARALLENLGDFGRCVYFSIVTFTTLGYGDFIPISPLARFFAATEALIGAISMSLFIVVFVRKRMR